MIINRRMAEEWSASYHLGSDQSSETELVEERRKDVLGQCYEERWQEYATTFCHFGGGWCIVVLRVSPLRICLLCERYTNSDISPEEIFRSHGFTLRAAQDRMRSCQCHRRYECNRVTWGPSHLEVSRINDICRRGRGTVERLNGLWRVSWKGRED